MEYKLRRKEIGKMFIDVTKYILTIVVIGAIISDKVNLRLILIGLGLASGIGLVGFLTLPEDDNKKEGN